MTHFSPSHLLLAQSQMSPAQWGILGFGAAMLIYMLVRPKLKRKGKDPLEDRPFHLSLTQQRSAEREMSHLLVELSEMARQVTAQLDTRAAKLELLIKEADEKLIRLQRHAGDTAARATDASPLPTDPHPTTAAGISDARHTEVYLLCDEGRSAAEIAQQLNRPSGEIELILALRPRR